MSERDSTIFNPTELKYLLIDSLKAYSEDVAYIEGNNPYTFSINKKVYHILIKNIHASGKGRPNQDECRIQIQQTENFLAAKNSGKNVLFLGYFADYNVFTVWNPRLLTPRINKKKVVSVYSRFSIQKKASENGIASYEDDNHQVIISFKPEYLGLYLENYDSMHQSTEKALLELIEESNETEETEKLKGDVFEIEKQKFTVTHRRFKRDIMFKKLVAETYSNRCAICGIQLDLVEAAHIIPHSHKKGTDDPTNGVCLCTLHHKAYDNGLIYFDSEYHIKLNDSKMRYLEKVKKDGGIMKFKSLQFDKLSLPTSKLYYPSKDFIRVANELRGIVE